MPFQKGRGPDQNESVIDHGPRDGAPGLYSIAGGKLAAYRLMCEQAPQAEAAFESLAASRPDDLVTEMHLSRMRDGERGATIDLRGG